MALFSGQLLLIPLFFLVFGLSATVNVRSAWEERARYQRGVLAGLFCQFTLLPFIGFCVVKAFDLGEIVGVPLLVVTSSPGGSYSNFWCSLFNADLALSVAMTTASTVLSVAFLPLNLLIWVNLAYDEGATDDLRWGGLFVGIGVVMLGVGSGLAASYVLEEDAEEPAPAKGGAPPGAEDGDRPPLTRKRSSHRPPAGRAARARAAFNALGQVSGVALILASAMFSRSEPIWDKEPGFYVACAMPCVLALGVSLGLARAAKLKPPEACAVSVECAYQNPGIATTVALNMFDGDRAAKAVGVPLYYGFVEAVAIGVFLFISWKRGLTHAPADASFCSVLRQNWQESGLHDAPADEAGEALADEADGGSARDGAPPASPPPEDDPAPLPKVVDDTDVAFSGCAGGGCAAGEEEDPAAACSIEPTSCAVA